MAFTKSAARTRMRYRIRDTVTTYEYSDAVVDTYLAAALKDIGVHVCEIDPDFYLRNVNLAAYTDATDAVASTEQGFEFYKLPDNLKSIRWIERGDGGYHYKIPVVGGRDQEDYRYQLGTTLGFTHVSVRNGATNDSYALSLGGGRETASLHGNKLRIVPPPTAAGVSYRVFYDAFPDTPQGDTEPVDIPVVFEEALILTWGALVIEDDGDPLAETLEGKRQAAVALAKTGMASRGNRSVTIGRVF